MTTPRSRAGYFTSRPTAKGYIRSNSAYLQAARQLEARGCAHGSALCCARNKLHILHSINIWQATCKLLSPVTTRKPFAGGSRAGRKLSPLSPLCLAGVDAGG